MASYEAPLKPNFWSKAQHTIKVMSCSRVYGILKALLYSEQMSSRGVNVHIGLVMEELLSFPSRDEPLVRFNPVKGVPAKRSAHCTHCLQCVIKLSQKCE